MGLLSSIASIAGPIAGTFLGGPVGGAIGGALGGLLGGRDTPSNATSTTQQQADPRIGNMLFGSNGSGGLLNQFQSMSTTPQSQALQNYGKTAGDYLNNYGSSDMTGVRNAATGLMSGNATPTTNPTAWAVGNQIQAPNQNNIDLSGSYKNLLSGGDTTALNSSMNAAVNATNAGYNTNLTNLTNTLQRQILPGISQNAVLAGQYGGSRQGVAEGNAISDFTNQANLANTQLAATNSANTTAQAANAYQQGQDRALSATQGLGAQQYGVATQNALTKNQAEFMNIGNVQQSNLANQGAQLQTNAQNNAGAVAGAGLLGGQSGTAYTAATNDQNYAMNQAKGVTGLLAPFIGVNQGSTTSQPIYQNTAGNLLGGALAGSQFGGLLGGGSTSAADARNSDGGGMFGLGGLFGSTPSSLSNMQGGTSSSIYAPSAGGGMNWGAMTNLASGGY